MVAMAAAMALVVVSEPPTKVSAIISACSSLSVSMAHVDVVIGLVAQNFECVGKTHGTSPSETGTNDLNPRCPVSRC